MLTLLWLFLAIAGFSALLLSCGKKDKAGKAPKGGKKDKSVKPKKSKGKKSKENEDDEDDDEEDDDDDGEDGDDDEPTKKSRKSKKQGRSQMNSKVSKQKNLKGNMSVEEINNSKVDMEASKQPGMGGSMAGGGKKMIRRGDGDDGAGGEVDGGDVYQTMHGIKDIFKKNAQGASPAGNAASQAKSPAGAPGKVRRGDGDDGEGGEVDENNDIYRTFHGISRDVFVKKK